MTDEQFNLLLELIETRILFRIKENEHPNDHKRLDRERQYRNEKTSELRAEMVKP